MDKTPKGNEVLDFEPMSLPAEHLRAIGLMSAAASSTDGIVEMAIAGMLGVDGEMGWAVTAHMSAPLRMSVLKSAAEIRIDEAWLLDALDEILDKIGAASAKRNDMVHGSWCVKPSTGEVWLVQQQARTHVQVTSRPVAVDEIELEARALYDAGMELMTFLMYCDVVPDLPRERQRGVNTPKARKAARKKKGKLAPPA